MSDQTLGEYLYHLRRVMGLTLRAVEKATDEGVSNSYLSQLEHDRIRKPSPNILHRLAEVYAIPHEVLMEKAGYITRASDREAPERRGGSTFGLDDLTAREEEELLRYLAFLRSRGPGRK